MPRLCGSASSVGVGSADGGGIGRGARHPAQAMGSLVGDHQIVAELGERLGIAFAVRGIARHRRRLDRAPGVEAEERAVVGVRQLGRPQDAAIARCDQALAVRRQPQPRQAAETGIAATQDEAGAELEPADPAQLLGLGRGHRARPDARAAIGAARRLAAGEQQQRRERQGETVGFTAMEHSRQSAWRRRPPRGSRGRTGS